jgi:hypothetical protein
MSVAQIRSPPLGCFLFTACNTSSHSRRFLRNSHEIKMNSLLVSSSYQVSSTEPAVHDLCSCRRSIPCDDYPPHPSYYSSAPNESDRFFPSSEVKGQVSLSIPSLCFMPRLFLRTFQHRLRGCRTYPQKRDRPYILNFSLSRAGSEVSGPWCVIKVSR